MPYDEALESRIQEIAARWKGIDSKKMFGGVCHLIRGNMFAGVYRSYLILRLGEEAGGKALSRPHVRPFDITGKPMKGWVMVEPEGIETDAALKQWLFSAKAFAEGLPKK